MEVLGKGCFETGGDARADRVLSDVELLVIDFQQEWEGELSSGRRFFHKDS